MLRTATLLLVVLALLVQSSGNILGIERAGGEQSVKHALMHWLNDSHHHHSDGSVHEDGSDESAWHVAMDHGGGSSAVQFAEVSGPHSAPPRLEPAAPRAHLAAQPLLEGPLRPPRSVA